MTESLNFMISVISATTLSNGLCGTFADFDYTDGSVTGDKQCKMMEDAISSNNSIIGISVEEKAVAQICHSKILRE